LTRRWRSPISVTRDEDARDEDCATLKRLGHQQPGTKASRDRFDWP
jgi:hypothetical protein